MIGFQREHCRQYERYVPWRMFGRHVVCHDTPCEEVILGSYNSRIRFLW